MLERRHHQVAVRVREEVEDHEAALAPVDDQRLAVVSRARASRRRCIRRCAWRPSRSAGATAPRSAGWPSAGGIRRLSRTSTPSVLARPMRRPSSWSASLGSSTSFTTRCRVGRRERVRRLRTSSTSAAHDLGRPAGDERRADHVAGADARSTGRRTSAGGRRRRPGGRNLGSDRRRRWSRASRSERGVHRRWADRLRRADRLRAFIWTAHGAVVAALLATPI